MHDRKKKGDLALEKIGKFILALLLLIVLILITFPLIKKAVAPILKIDI